MWWSRYGAPILIAVLLPAGVIAATAIPNACGVVCSGHPEVSAIATLRVICSSQHQFREQRHLDLDRDGHGEFGCIQELSGHARLRGGREALDPWLLPGAFRRVTEEGIVRRGAYCYRIFLPDANGDGVSEQRVLGITGIAETVGFDREPDPDGTESRFCAYAWPRRYGHGSGGGPRRTFFIAGVTGDVLATDDPDYEGSNAPKPGAAFADCGPDVITGATANGTTGQDGNVWRKVK